ncbi:MAG: carboxypeptidase-like regulatory domain-containing protein, partial [Candidatus Cryptobacteroides sp.]
MKNILLILLGALCSIPSLMADGRTVEASIHGHIIEKATGEHIPYIFINLKGTTISASSASNGHYHLEHLPEGTFFLEASGVGWKTVSKQVRIVEGHSLEVNFELEEDNVLLAGVVVSANRSEISRKMAPTLVNVMNMETYDRVNATSLSQGLVFQPGV